MLGENVLRPKCKAKIRMQVSLNWTLLDVNFTYNDKSGTLVKIGLK